jgi:hypothetical protein
LRLDCGPCRILPRPATRRCVTGEGIEAALAARLADVDRIERRARLAADRVDLRLPGRRAIPGAEHPLSLVLGEIIDVFVGLGFAVADGPEVESDYYILTDMTRDRLARDARYRALMLERTPLGRPGRPEDVAGAAVFLASADRTS